jgi:HAD superfamily hydrolase (TIGR01549 family)
MLKAMIWDFDGTLVDTRVKNLNVTKAIIAEVTGGKAEEFPALSSLPAYENANTNAANWRELYKKEFALTDRQTDYAGSLWTKFQLIDQTSVTFFNGIVNAIKKLDDYSHGIVSQNSRKNIQEMLSAAGINNCFKTIIGYEEVDYSMQKPHPEGLLYCISQLVHLKLNEKVLFIGDHETDAACAANANKKFSYKAVFSAGAFYEKNDHSDLWKYKPDFKANHPDDIVEIADQLNNQHFFK